MMDQKDKLRTIIDRLILGDKEWLKEKHILVTRKGDYWILNYLQGPRNEYNRLVRGMVIGVPSHGWVDDELKLIKSFPFTRFFNHVEKEAATVDFAKSDMIEKFDGTMVAVFFPDGDHTTPQWHTRKMISLDVEDMWRKVTSFRGRSYDYMRLIGSYVNQLKFAASDVGFTFIFEFIHEASQVMTKYEPKAYGLYLIGVRNVLSHYELTENELDDIADEIRVRRPRRWNAVTSMDEIGRMFKEAGRDTPDFEGFVFRDRMTGNRVKVKDPEYVRKHHFVTGMGNVKSLLQVMLREEEDEVLAYFPQAKKFVEEIRWAYIGYVNRVVDRVQEWWKKGLEGGTLGRVLFAKDSPEQDPFIRQQIITCINKHHEGSSNNIWAVVDDSLKRIALGDGHNEGCPKKVMEMIGLKEKEEVECE